MHADSVFQIKGQWFIEGGITPEGKSWVVPSPNFLDRWLEDDNLSDRLTELGFSYSTDGKEIGHRKVSSFIIHRTEANEDV